MVSIKSVDAGAVKAVVSKTPKVDLSSFVKMFEDLKVNTSKVFEVTPEDSKKMRKTKHNLTTAAKTVGVRWTGGETEEGSIIVWFDDSEVKPKRSRKNKEAVAA